MQFLFPSFLWTFALLSIPVIIHLFYFRRFKKVYFTNVRFLKEVKEETSSRSRIKNLLILLMRLLAFSALILAFAQPFLPVSDEVKQGRNAVSIFVDNSFSMGSVGSAVALLEMAKLRATEVIDAYKESDVFQVITQDLEGRHQRWVPKEEALDLVNEIRISPSSAKISSIAQRQNEMFQQNQAFNPSAYWISDFQENMWEDVPTQDTSVRQYLIPLSAVQQTNIGIDTVWMEEPVAIAGSPVRFQVQVQNYGANEVTNIRLAFTSNGEEKPVSSFNLGPGEKAILNYTFNPSQPGWQDGFFQITDYPIQFDDFYYLSFEVVEEINVLTISEGEVQPALKRTLEGVERFKNIYLRTGSIDYALLAQQDLIILDEPLAFSSGLIVELTTFLKNGGKILFFPSSKGNLRDYASFTGIGEWSSFQNSEKEMGTINFESEIFKDVFAEKTPNLRLPFTRGNFPLPNRGSSIFSYRDGSPAISQLSVDQGILWISAAPLNKEFSSLSETSEIFIPMLYKMAILKKVPKKLNHWIGVSESIAENHIQEGGELIYKIKGEKTELIPSQRLSGNQVFLDLSEGIEEAGFYTLQRRENEVLSQYAFNYLRSESLQQFLKDAELKEKLPEARILSTEINTSLTSVIEQESRGIPLWKWFLLIAIAALIMETLLLRFYREK